MRPVATIFGQYQKIPGLQKILLDSIVAFGFYRKDIRPLRKVTSK
jgi:hypothetical protein